MMRLAAGRRSRVVVLVLSFALVSMLAATVGALAADRFSDVAADHQFRDEIGWMADSGISEGFDDGTFRPTNAVTRQAMAAFMQRLAGHDPDVEPIVHAASLDGYEFVVAAEETTDAVIDMEVTCPAGMKAVGGGGLVDDLFSIAMSGPTEDGDGWFVVWLSMDFQPWTVGSAVVATCLPAGDAALRAATAPVPDAERGAMVDPLRARVEARQATD